MPFYGPSGCADPAVWIGIMGLPINRYFFFAIFRFFAKVMPIQNVQGAHKIAVE